MKQYFRETYEFLNVMPLGKDKFTDGGYRLRLNNINILNYWFWDISYTETFLDLIIYNFFTIETKKTDDIALKG